MEPSIPSEFAAFVHDVAIRAFDNLGSRIRELETPLRGVARSWSKLSEDEKIRFVDELIAAAQGTREPNDKSPKPRRAVKRFDPAEVKKTLPKKPKKKAAAKKKTKAP